MRFSAASVPFTVPPSAKPDDGIRQVLDDAARDDDVGLAEEDEHVAVARRRRHVNDLDRLVVEVELARAAEERVGRRMPVRQARRRDAQRRVLMREDRGALRRRRRARRELRVAADVRRVIVGVDDDADAFVGRDLCRSPRARRRRAPPGPGSRRARPRARLARRRCGRRPRRARLAPRRAASVAPGDSARRRLRRPLRAPGARLQPQVRRPARAGAPRIPDTASRCRPERASSGTLCRFANMSRLSFAPGMNDGTLPRSIAISSVGAHLKKTSLAPKPSPSPPFAKPPNSASRVLARASSRKSVDRTNGSSRYSGSSTAVTSVR